MKKSILTAALLGGIALPLAGAASPLGTGVQETAKQEAEKAPADPAVALAKDYEAAYEAYRKKLREADREERKALRKQAPITEYWPRFEALARKNNGRALLWLADNIKSNKAIKKDQRAKVLEPIFDALAEHHTGAEWFGDVLASLGKNARDFEPKKVAALYTKVVEGSKDKDVQAQALFYGARALAKEDPKTSAAFLARIGEDFGNTHYFTMAQSLSVKAADVEQGKTAPDFYGETIDGFGFNLEDYRGKVVALDFYGFW